MRSCARSERPCEHGQNRALRLTAGMDLEAAVLLEGESVHRLELGMENAVGGVRPLERGGGCAKRGSTLGVVNHKRSAARCSDLPGAVIEDVLLRHHRSITRGPIDLDEVSGADRRRIRCRAYDDPTGHRLGGILQHEAREISLDPLRRGVIDGADH